MIRKDVDGIIRYSLSNSRYKFAKLAYMQGQRYFIERAFQDAKQQVGLNQYQTRSYAGWYRHVSMSMLAMQFITEEKKHKEVYLTIGDIVKLIMLLIPAKKVILKELNKQIKKKNKRYKSLVKSSNLK